MENKWTEKWPKKEGYYWYYGHPYKNKIEKVLLKEPSLHVVQVRKIQNGFMVTRNGHLWFESEKGEGLFKKIKNPDLPDISNMMNIIQNVEII
jgi:hypothetical protein